MSTGYGLSMSAPSMTKATFTFTWYVAFDPAWLGWNGGIVKRLAEGIYDGRAFDRLPILADALEEAGCLDPDILNHCRQPGEHGRCCGVIFPLLASR